VSCAYAAGVPLLLAKHGIAWSRIEWFTQISKAGRSSHVAYVRVQIKQLRRIQSLLIVRVGGGLEDLGWCRYVDERSKPLPGKLADKQSTKQAKLGG
jgi:hypothetical protein